MFMSQPIIHLNVKKQPTEQASEPIDIDISASTNPAEILETPHEPGHERAASLQEALGLLAAN